jgi:hypothetical protein
MATGHEVSTVQGQALQKVEDPALLEQCRGDGRALVTLDLDFANPLRFLPSRSAGIAVLRLPKKPSRADLLAAIRTLARALEREELEGKLWIVETGRIRVFQEETPED